MLEQYNLTYKPYGNQAILIEWPAQIDEKLIQDILAFQKGIKHQKIQDIIIAYHTLTLVFNQPYKNFERWVEYLKEIYLSRELNEKTKSLIWQIPVCYDEEFGMDLQYISSEKKISISNMIKLHSETSYLIYFFGFQPGFFYLGGLHERLHIPRKPNPRLRVEKGSVAIGGAQTGVYSQDSSGGWNIIGKCPLDLFDISKSRPTFAKPGDRVQFISISKSEFFEIESQVRLKSYQPKFFEV